MLGRDFDDEVWPRFVFELVIWHNRLLWIDELNPRVRCAFGNVCHLALAQIWLLNHYNWACRYLDLYYIDFGVSICDDMSLSQIFCHLTSSCSDLVSATVITTHPSQIFHFSQSERSSQCRKRMTGRLLLLDKNNFFTNNRNHMRLELLCLIGTFYCSIQCY